MRKRWMASFMLFIMLLCVLPANVTEAATYQKGSYGTQVQILQQNMNFLGFSVGYVDGEYGNQTRNAVIKMQKALHIEETGLVDEALYELIKGTVTDIQMYLKCKGYYKGSVDGVAGSETTSAYKSLLNKWGYWYTVPEKRIIFEKILADKSVDVSMNYLEEWILRLENTYENEVDKIKRVHPEWSDEYIALFTESPQYLNNVLMNQYLSFCLDEADKVLRANNSANETVIGAFLTGLSKGKDIIWHEVANSITGVVHSYEEDMHLESITCLLQDISAANEVVLTVTNEVADRLKDVSTGIDLADYAAKAQFIDELAKSCKSLSREELSEIVDTMLEKEYAGLLECTKYGIKLSEYITGLIQLHEVGDATVERMLEIVPEDSDLHKDLVLYMQDKKNNYSGVQLVVDTLADIVGDDLYRAIAKGIGVGESYPTNVMMAVAEVCIDVFVNQIYQGTLSDDLIQAFLLQSYMYTMNSTVIDMQLEFVKKATQNQKVTMKEIEDYEFAYQAYLSVVKTYIRCVQGMGDEYEARLLEPILDSLDETANYRNYINVCFKEMESQVKIMTVQEKMDYLLDILDAEAGEVSYFTVNQKACETVRKGGHSCTNCNVEDIVKTTWFKNIFGEVNTGYFPAHDVNSGWRDYRGQSCFGFACFAQWYLYADSLDENVAGKRVATGTFTSSFVKNNVLPGDVLRIADKDGGHHSVLIYSVESDHIVVLDSNWSHDIYGNENLNCRAQKHLIYYNNEYYAGRATYVNRVTKTEELGKGIAGTYLGIGVPSEGQNKAGGTTTIIPIVTPTVPVTSVSSTSDWVKASECPVGATIVDTKWTYSFTERMESSSGAKDGWLWEGERKEIVASGSFDYAIFPDTFDTSHAVYKGMYANKDAVAITEGTVREILSDVPAGYVYWHYSYPIGDQSVGNRIVGYYRNQHLKVVGNWCYATEFSAFKSDKKYTSTANNKAGGGTVYKITDSEYMKYNVAKGSYWWYRFEYNTCTYQDVKTVYQYYKVTEKESMSEVYEGNGISNVVKWVKYQ